MVYFNICLLKVFLCCIINIYKLLWVPIYQREPATLYLYHNAVAFLESMCNISQLIAYFLYFTGCKGFGLLEAVAVAPAEYFPMHQHFVATHGVAAGKCIIIIIVNRN